jgi:Na+:H+ antiporter, NhaA family
VSDERHTTKLPEMNLDALGESVSEADEATWADSAVTASIYVRPVAGREQEFEAFLDGITGAAAKAPGFVSSRVFRPRGNNRDYRMVVRFDSTGNLHRWKESDERRAWYTIAEEVTEQTTLMTNITGTAQERPLVLALAPFESFVRTSVSGIGLLLVGTLLALVMANSPLSDFYDRIWDAKLTMGFASASLTESTRHWVNDGLMTLFFFIVGLEIKREVLVGEMRYPRQAALPIAAAIGGGIVPALVFLAINMSGEGQHGWGIAMATDTAFSLGILTLLGTRVRPLLLVFVTAFAIVDDILAVLVIAVFYTDQIHWKAAVVAVLLLAALGCANLAGFHRWPVYAGVGVCVWVAVFESGIHGTLAGILVAMTVPARSWINPSEFLLRGRQAMDDFEAACFIAPSILSNEPQQQATQALERLCEEVETPMTHLQHRLNPWVAYGILPIFAFANAGIPLVDGLGNAIGSPIAWGVMAGLVIGKPVGITLFAWLAVKLGVAIKPRAITWTHIGAVACLGGIGFTISLFVTELAFEAGPFADDARIGILFASVFAGILSYLVLQRTLPPPREETA